jgi:hypothetical protein
VIPPSKTFPSVCFFLFTAAAYTAAQNLTGVPAKLLLSADTTVSRPGGSAAIRIEVVDPDNKPVAVSKDVSVEMETKSEKGESQTKKVIIKAGQTNAVVDVSTATAGSVEVNASSPQLANGGTVFTVPKRPSVEQPTPSPAATPVATVAPLDIGQPVVTGAAPPSGGGTTSRSFHMRSTDFAGRRETGSAASSSGGSHVGGRAPASVNPFNNLAAAATRPAPNIGPSATPAANPQPAQKRSIHLKYYPKRPLRADDEDPATVVASISPEDPDHPEMSVYLWSDLGPLTPEPIKIPDGRVDGSAKLIGTGPGGVQVGYSYSVPAASAADEPLKINFIHPVWAPRLVPDERKITLLDSTEVAVEFVNRKGVLVPADVSRPVDISVDTGSGDLSQTQVTIAADASRGTTKFTPKRAGKVRLVARSPYLPEQFADIYVIIPFGLLGLCGLGSVLGALVAYWTETNASWKRIPIGFITGYVLYSALVCGILATPKIPHTYLLNPFVAVLIAIVGGFAGTKVFSALFKQFGL